MRARMVLAASVMTLTSLAVTPARSLNVQALEPGLLDAIGPVQVLARFEQRIPTLPAGIDVHYRFGAVPAVYATADAGSLRALAARDDLVLVERAKPIAFDLDSATVASRARAVWSGPEPIEIGGEVVDGAGVGLAIVDTGLDGLHPDYQVPGKVGGNYLVTPAGVTPTSYSATGESHGTHVAGIATGNGAASGGTLRGAAPGSTLYAFGVAVGGTTAFPAIAYDWILQHGAEQDPPIRVVNNSWHCRANAICARMNPDNIHMHLASQLAENGIVVTWSAGNDGGDGFIPQTNLESINATPGIISVANYDDDDRGLRTRCVQAGSSRGAAAQPETWPDVAAPGRFVVSTWAMGPATPAQNTQYSRTPDGRNNYRQASGTSMAAPHVAGIAALMLQANPALTPAEVEYLLKATAAKLNCTVNGSAPDPSSSDPKRRDPLPYPASDPQHPFDGANFIDGHGLVDARAAVEAAVGFTGIPVAPAPEPLPELFQSIRSSVDTDRTLYLRDPDGMAEEVPTREVGARVLLSDEPVIFESGPLAAHDTEALELELWFGTNAETQATFVGRTGTVHNNMLRFQITIERVSGDETETLVSTENVLRLAAPAIPVYRRWVYQLAEEHPLADGDRLRLRLNLRSSTPDVPSGFGWILYADAADTPSALSLGHKVRPVLAGTSRECKIRHDCAEIGGPRRHTSFECNIEQTLPDYPRVQVTWHGPPGSTAGVRCGNSIALCTVPGEAADPWSTCVAETPVLGAIDTYDTSCFYLGPEGEHVEGRGRCEQVPMSLVPHD